MEKFKLETNNSKKLIIGVSILFCAVILIFGATTAYFTQSDSKNTGNIVTTDINGTIGYSDNDDYMRGNLIPVEETDVSLFVMKNSSHSSGKYTNDDKCKYQDDMYACSLYQFTIINNANVTQELMVTLNPYPNGFSNLYYMIYEGEQDKLTTESKVAKTNTHIDGTNPSTIINSVILKPQESKTYTVVFYIKNLKDIDQTNMDAGKNFGAIIRVDSITTATYVLNAVGETCYGVESLDDGTFKLTSFNGINSDGTVVGGCGVTQVEEGLYDIDIPSKVGSNEISTIGESVFSNKNLSSVKIPSTITSIENFAFYWNPYLTTVTIPSSLITIGESAFGATNLKILTFTGAEDGSSQLQTIGKNAFYGCNITTDVSNPLIIPYSVQTIGSQAFENNRGLTSLTFSGSLDGSSMLKEIGDSAFRSCNLTYETDTNPLILPSSVPTMGVGVFSGNSNLKFIYYPGDTSGFDSSWFNSDVTILTELVNNNQ